MGRSFLIVVALLLVSGCQRSAKPPSGVVHELEHGDGKSIERALLAHVEAVKDYQEEEDEAIAAAARERASYKQLLEKEMGFIDQRITELESEAARASAKTKDDKANDLAAAKSFRALLRKDFEDIERTNEDVWPPLKDRIDHDLEEERPKSVPSAFEKSYGI